MLVDFCHHCLGSKIKTDKVSFDGYEVTNLLSSDLALKNKGFLSDHFIKPPVNITVQFPCNISIYRIVVDPVIGRQQSCDIKLFTGTKTVSTSWLYGNDDSSSVSCDGLLLNNIGSVTTKDPLVICFQNSFFRERNLWQIDNLSDSYQYPIRTQLRGRKPGSLCNASHLNICVTRVRSGGSVAIKRLEVWGMPSSMVPIAVQQLLLNTYRKAVYPNEKEQTDTKNFPDKTLSTTEHAQDVASVIEDGVHIPDDFIDQITYEVMSVPMLLPCGKNVDQSTVERFVNTEASWGRAPSDPFTGVLFSPGHQAIPNVALKARLDQFLLKHSGKLKVARTLGRSECAAADIKMKTSRLVCESQTARTYEDLGAGTRSVKEENSAVEGRGKVIKSGTLNKNIPVEYYTSTKYADILGHGKKRKLQDERQTNKKTCTTSSKNISLLKTKQVSEVSKQFDNCGVLLTTTVNNMYTNSTPTDMFGKFTNNLSRSKEYDSYGTKHNNTDIPKTDIKDKGNTINHTNKLSISLDSALNDVLGNLPSFTSFSTVKADASDSSVKVMLCCFCESSLDSESVIKYKLPCTHYICRNCAQQIKKTDVCKLCEITFSSDELTRVF